MTIYKTLDFQSLLVDATAGGVSLTLPSGTVMYAECQVLDSNRELAIDASIRISTDSDETLTAGGAEGSPLIPVGSVFEVWGRDELRDFRAIRAGGSSAYLQVHYYGTV